MPVIGLFLDPKRRRKSFFPPTSSILSAMFTGVCSTPEKLSLALVLRSYVLCMIVKLTYCVEKRGTSLKHFLKTSQFRIYLVKASSVIQCAFYSACKCTVQGFIFIFWKMPKNTYNHYTVTLYRTKHRVLLTAHKIPDVFKVLKAIFPGPCTGQLMYKIFEMNA